MKLSLLSNRPALMCVTLSLLALTACSSETEDLAPAPTPAPAEAISLIPAPAAPATAPGNTAAPVAQNVLSSTDPAAYSQKDIAKIIEHLDWFAENYISQKNRIPTLDELKAWKDPNYPLGLPEWPKAPAGKEWVMNEKSGQFSLADVAAP
ncbi:MAG TPA: hypothetical protein VGH19_03025 [Verrucomicrobiae bacterium]